MVKVSIVIPTYKRTESLMGALRSLLNQQYEDFEIIIIDQSPSHDQALDGIINENKKRVKYITSGLSNASLARNKGLEEAAGGIIICCDDDIIAAPGFIKNHAVNYKDGNIGSVAGRVLCANDLPAEKIRHVGKLREWDGRITSNFNANFRTEVDHAYGCNVSYKRELLVKTGGYDGRLTGTGSFDDADVSLKIRKLGYKVIFDPRAEVRHIQASGGYRCPEFRKKIFWYYHNFAVFYLKHMRRIFLPVFLARQILGIFRRCIVGRDAGVLISGMKGLIYGFRDYSQKA